MMSDAQDRPRTFPAVTKGLIRIRLGRTGDGIGVGLDPFLIFLRRFYPFLLVVEIVLIPGGFGLFHPERTNLNWVLWTFMITAAGLLCRRTHQVGSSRNCDHLELHFCAGNRFHIVLMIKFV